CLICRIVQQAIFNASSGNGRCSDFTSSHIAGTLGWRSVMSFSLEEHYRERNSRNDHQRASANFFTRESAVDMEDVTKQARDYHSHEQYRNEVSQAETERVHAANGSAQSF